MGIAPAGHIAACGGHRDQFLTGKEPVGQFRLEVRHGVALCLGEAADTLTGILDVLFKGLRQAACGVFDAVGRDRDIAGPIVEFRRVIARAVLALGFDLGQNLGHDLGRVGTVGRRRLGRLLQVLNGHGLALSYWSLLRADALGDQADHLEHDRGGHMGGNVVGVVLGRHHTDDVAADNIEAAHALQ